MKARLKFSKMGSMRFVGHLDVMRYFQKAFRRAQIPVSVSQGFSPHPLMSFASPLGIGLSSEGEYLDLVLEELIEPEEFLQNINQQMNEEISVTDFLYLTEESKSSMSVLAACDYLILLKPERTSFLLEQDRRKQAVQRLLERKEIPIVKKTKRSEQMVDIREYIYQVAEGEDAKKGEQMTNFLSADYQPLLFFQLTAGSVVNIKPELVLEALHEQENEEYEPFAYQIHRLEMYADATMKKGEVHTIFHEPFCELVSFTKYEKEEEVSWSKNC